MKQWLEAILMSVILTFFSLIGEDFRKNSYFFQFFVTLLIILSIFFMFSTLEATPSRYQSSIQKSKVLEYLKYQSTLTAEQHAYFSQQIKQNTSYAKYCLAKAEQLCDYLPLHERETAKYCFSSIAAMPEAVMPNSKSIEAIQALFIDFGLNNLKEIMRLLEEAHYHFEMAEFFEGVLVNG